MTDIHAGVMLVGVCSLAAFWFCRWLAPRLPIGVTEAVAILTVAITLLYAKVVWYSVSLVELLPYSNLIILGNWFLPLSATLAGVIWHRIPGGLLRRSVTTGVLLATAAVALVTPVAGPPPICRDVWSARGYCVQTTDETCSAACAATLLHHHGIAANEQEMAELCFSRGGTTWLGLYRGLKLKTRGTAWDVRVIDETGGLLEQASSPMILSVGIDWWTRANGSLELEGGWTPGMRHSVILQSVSAGKYAQIVDPNPSIGEERWTVDDLKLLCRGPALQLVPR